MNKEILVRSIPWLGLIPTAVLLLLSGCGSSSNSSPSSVQPPSNLSYTDSTAVYTEGTAITANNPTNLGGAVSSYSVSPDLPAGLSLSTSTGIITGTPTAVTATANYTVTASNSAGNTTTTLTITVNVPPLSADNINLIFVVSEDLTYQRVSRFLLFRGSRIALHIETILLAV